VLAPEMVQVVTLLQSSEFKQDKTEKSGFPFSALQIKPFDIKILIH
jgi:hypothetical protein